MDSQKATNIASARINNWSLNMIYQEYTKYSDWPI